MRSISEGCNTGIYIGSFLAVGLLALAVRADDYTLAAGESATFDNGLTNNYGTLYISGDLTVSDNTWLIGNNATAAVLSGGTVTVDGRNTVFGNQANGNNGQKEMFLNPGADGKYTMITVRNGRNGSVSGDYYNVGAKYLTIGADTEEARAQYPDGVFHFLDISGACANFHKLINNSSLTGLVTIAGNSQFGKGNGYGGSFFDKGNFLVEVAQGANVKYNGSNQVGIYNTAGCNVHVTGDGNLEFSSVYQGGNYASVRLAFNRGAVINVTGTLTFDSGSWGTRIGWYSINDNNVFGSSIGKIKSGSSASNATYFEVTKDVEIAIHDLEMKRNNDRVIGKGVIRIDASAASRKFEAVIPTSYAMGSTEYENTLTIAKSGAYDAEVVATNVPTLRVDEGAVRLTTDCVVGSLKGAPGAKVIADGCTVTIASGRHVPNGLELATANGGKFVKADSGTAYMYGPVVLGTDLRIAGGNVVFSKYGLDEPYWRWTFSKTATSPNPLWLGRLWLFDINGGHPGTNLSYVATTQALSPGQARFQHDPSVTLTLDSTATGYQQWWHFSLVFSDDLFKNINNFVKLATPVIDPADSMTHLAVEMRLRADDKPVSGYTFMSEDDKHYPVSWKVEASNDGQTWTEVDSRSDVVHAKPGYGYFYDGASYTELQSVGKPVELFAFSGYKRDGLEADPTKPMSLQVDEGASVDLTAFTVAPQKIVGLTVDFVTSGSTNTCGTIYGGSIAQGGTLTILNAGQDFGLGVPLPITLDGASDARNFGTWSVLVNGAEMHGCLRLNSDDHPVLTALATVLIFR